MSEWRRLAMRRDEAERWQPLEEQIAADVLKAEVEAWARRIGVEPKEVHVRPMKRKWASCSSKGRVTLSEDLLAQPAAFRAEAMVHELLRLEVPNHGKLLKTLLRTYLLS